MIEVAFITHSGLRRSVNEDAIAVTGHFFQRSFTLPEVRTVDGIGSLIALADGVSSSPSAARASLKVLRLLHEKVSRSGSVSSSLIHDVQSDLSAVATSKTSGMASTLAGVLLDGDHFTAFNVGDSRVYRFRREVLSQVSQDHSVIARMVRDGEVSATNAKNVATMYRGLESSLIADLHATEFDIWIDTLTLEEGTAILLCTDGVTEAIDDEGLTEILLANESDPAAAVKAIYQRVMESGAEDNFSIVLSLCRASAMEKEPIENDDRYAP